jgi:hypothetical protein
MRAKNTDRPSHPKRADSTNAIELLWTSDRATFEGRYVELRGAVANPKPIQQPRPPIWIGALGPKMLGVVARHADVWHWAGEGLDDAIRAGRELIARCDQLGRPTHEIRWSAQFTFDGEDPSRLVEEMERWYHAGFSELVVSCSGGDPVRTAGVVAETVLPATGRLR